MSRNSSGRGVGRNRPYLPRVEALEEREVPTVNFRISESTLLIQPARSPSSLTLTGDRITILDNGTNGSNNVIALANGRAFVPNVAISDIVVLGSRQDDVVQYNLTGDLLSRRGVFVDLGRGDDRFEGFLRRNLRGNAGLAISIRGGQGDDRITNATVAQLAAGSMVDINLDGGAGNDTVRAVTTSFVGIARDARYDVVINGGSGNDIMQSTYQGDLDGSTGLMMDAGGGEDQASASYSLVRGSTGIMPPALILGGTGDDDLSLLITNLGTGLSINSIIDGGGGTNTCTRTTNVIAMNCSQDTVL